MSSTLSGHVQEPPLPRNCCRVLFLQSSSSACKNWHRIPKETTLSQRKITWPVDWDAGSISILTLPFFLFICNHIWLCPVICLSTLKEIQVKATWAVFAYSTPSLRCSRKVSIIFWKDSHLGLLEDMSVWLLWISPPHAGQLCPKPVPVLQKVSNTVTYTPKGTENTTELEHSQVLTNHGRRFGQMTRDSRSWFAFSKPRLSYWPRSDTKKMYNYLRYFDLTKPSKVIRVKFSHSVWSERTLFLTKTRIQRLTKTKKIILRRRKWTKPTFLHDKTSTH